MGKMRHGRMGMTIARTHMEQLTGMGRRKERFGRLTTDTIAEGAAEAITGTAQDPRKSEALLPLRSVRPPVSSRSWRS